MRPSVSAALLCLAAGGCAADDGIDLPPLDYESARARIGVDDRESDPLCAADLDHIDHRVELVEDRLGVSRDDPVEIYLLDHDAIPCGEAFAACYDRGDDAIYADWSSLDHEIVHAVTREIDFPSVFIEEGAAAMLDGGTTRKDPNVTLTAEMLDYSYDDLVNYATVSHFARFLVETRGWEAYNRVIRGDSFDAAYGEPADALTAAYEAEAPAAYPPLEPCPYPPLPEVDVGVWQEQVTIACGLPDVTQFELTDSSETPAPAVVRRLDLEAGTYLFDLNPAGSLVLLGCHTEVLAELPTLPSNGDLFNEVDFGTGTKFPSIGAQQLTLTAGWYRVAIQAPLNESFEAELTVTRIE